MPARYEGAVDRSSSWASRPGTPRHLTATISTYDIQNNFSSTFIWDFPVGHRRRFLADAPGVVNALLGQWTISGVFRMPGGTPFLPFITDPNKLGGVLFNRVVRPDIVEGVPLRNPLWDRNCDARFRTIYHQAAFMASVKVSLGNAPAAEIAPGRSLRLLAFEDFPWPVAGMKGSAHQLRVD